MSDSTSQFGDQLITVVIGGVILIAIIAIVIWKSVGKKRFSSNTVLLLGPCNAGKTVLFLQMRDGKYRGTQTSMKENEGTFVIHSQADTGKAVHVVDFPGHQRLRPHLKDFTPITRAIVFLLDAVEFDSQVRSVAEYLYDLFCDKNLNKHQVPILIACNKNDILTAKRLTFVKTAIEKEIDQLRYTRKAAPGQDETEDVIIGTEGKAFTFDQLDNEIILCECSAMKGEIQGVVDFINERVR